MVFNLSLLYLSRCGENMYSLEYLATQFPKEQLVQDGDESLLDANGDLIEEIDDVDMADLDL